jgi:hypothetical protein
MTSDRPGADDQLPWLQAVEDEQEPAGISAGRMLSALMLVLAAVAIVGAVFFWLGRREAAGEGPPELIAAPPGPYKVKPEDPGGLDVAGESETAFQTSAGEDRDSRIDLNALPEEPMAKPTAEEPKKIPPNELREPLPPEGTPAVVKTGGNGTVIQLGAFQNGAQAERAWSALSARFPAIAAMNKMVIPFSGGVRLRAGAASPTEAKAACQALKAAGENCFVAQ